MNLVAALRSRRARQSARIGVEPGNRAPRMPQELRSLDAEGYRYPHHAQFSRPLAVDPAGPVENAVAFTTAPCTARSRRAQAPQPLLRLTLTSANPLASAQLQPRRQLPTTTCSSLRSDGVFKNPGMHVHFPRNERSASAEYAPSTSMCCRPTASRTPGPAHDPRTVAHAALRAPRRAPCHSALAPGLGAAAGADLVDRAVADADTTWRELHPGLGR